MKVIKRDGKSVDFDPEKIRIAIGKACDSVAEEDRITDRQIENIVKYVAEQSLGTAKLRNCEKGLEATISLPVKIS